MVATSVTTATLPPESIEEEELPILGNGTGSVEGGQRRGAQGGVEDGEDAELATGLGRLADDGDAHEQAEDDRFGAVGELVGVDVGSHLTGGLGGAHAVG